MNQNGICIIWDCGFFSCCSQRLGQIIRYANNNQRFPDCVDSSRQFSLYKPVEPSTEKTIDITHKFFNQQMVPKFDQKIQFTDQFTDYKKINYALTYPIIKSYFNPSHEVISRINLYEKQYGFDYENTCGIFYRGNDKIKECGLASYKEYAQRALEIQSTNPKMKFFVQTDDSLFVEYFEQQFHNDCFHIKELPKIHDANSAVTYQLNRENRLSHAIDLVSVVNILAKCKTIIVHSGNCAYWTALYRGKPDGIIQHFTNEHRNQDRWI
jgi:hypothetical protein